MQSYTVSEVWDIPIRINVSLLVFLPILAWLLGNGRQIALYAGLVTDLTGAGFDVAGLQAGATPWVIGVVAAVGLFVSVTVHELGHSWVALRYGIEIESITLWILGGLASLKTVPREWNREFWIAVAGPLTSVLVAVVCLVGVLVLPSSLEVARFVLGWLGVTNLTLAAFNLLPAFPMDGGRVFRALLARRRPYATATRIASRVGVLFALLFAVVGVLGFQLLLLLLALFLYNAATTESRTVLLDELLDGLTVGDVMSADPATVEASATVEEFGARMLRDRQTIYLVTDGDRPVGVVSLDDLRSVGREERSTVTVGSVAHEVPRVEAGADAFESLAVLMQAGARNALVESDGRLVGLLSEADYARALTIQRGFQSTIPG
ncbi:MAG: site-2 protease family protein [Haloplanus sp.]